MSNGPFYKLSLSTRNSCTPSMQFGSKVFQIPWTIVRQFKTVILKMCMCWPVIYWRCSSVAEVNRLLNLIGWRAAYIHGRVTRSCICHSIKFLSSPTTEGRCVSHIADFFFRSIFTEYKQFQWKPICEQRAKFDSQVE